MNERGAGNLAHSVQERLRNRARNEGRLYEELLVRHGLERFLHRLGESEHRADFVLKGALLLQVWTGLDARPTRDIDLLGPLRLEPEALREVIARCCSADVAADGWEFLGGSEVAIQPIRQGAAYHGLRAVFTGHLGRSRVRMQLDVGSGDEVVPPPERVVLPTLLGQPPPDLFCYSPYTSIAEKLDAIILLGMSNSRMKDYFDIALLANHLEFSGARLREAIAACCRRRHTVLSTELPEGLDDGFALDGVARERWRGFVEKSGLSEHAAGWAETVRACREFLAVPLRATAGDADFSLRWTPGGPWLPSEQEA